MACTKQIPNVNDWIVKSNYCKDGPNKPPYSDTQLEVLNMCVQPFIRGSMNYLQSPCLFKNVYQSIAEDDPLQKKFGCAVNCYDDLFAKEKGKGQIYINDWWPECVTKCDKNPGGNEGVVDENSGEPGNKSVVDENSGEQGNKSVVDENPGEPGNAGVDDEASADKNVSDTTSDAGIVSNT